MSECKPLLTEKQREYLLRCNHRWNIKSGAVRSGKTYADYFNIPLRLQRQMNGIIVFIGATRGALERNIFSPMRKIWGGELIGHERGDGVITLFGRQCWVLSGSIAGEASKMQGASVSYCYGDEVTLWSEKVFRMLQSRLDRPESVFDGTCNPASRGHWFKRFLDSDCDLYLQLYTLDDNPFVDESFKENLKREYAGTVFYDRYIKGEWVAAEGAIYKAFAAEPSKFIVGRGGADIARVIIGLDFGGNRSKHAAVAVGEDGSGNVTALLSARFEPSDPERLYLDVGSFLSRLRTLYGVEAESIQCDAADPMLIRGLRERLAADELSVSVRACAKSPVLSRIRRTLALMGSGRLKLTLDADTLTKAFENALWDGDTDRRLDDFTSDIDTLDAFEYALEKIRL